MTLKPYGPAPAFVQRL